MPVGDKQKLITEMLGLVLNQAPKMTKFHWFINQHHEDHFKESFQVIQKIYLELGGNNSIKRSLQLQSDAYFGGAYNFLFEFDEIQHFSTARLKSLSNYPENLNLNYSVIDWKRWCLKYSSVADKYRFNKTTMDFNFKGGRTCQRAYLDCFRDFLPQYNGLNPTLRISEFEVKDINQIDDDSLFKVKKIVLDKLKFPLSDILTTG